ncbi:MULTISPECIES: TetR/AcrR family transcriptional regulator [Mycobacteriaceae]|uniref:TetR/AcrR family transcriptional regulator n=1 Tax=Mycobacteriaceae TaxID=1762 RepID=UPI001CDA4AAE|nr:TetR/AcrR family transcriptional regulator [Mycobacterium sp. WUMAC-067]MCA2243388.1 TetR/AcrR family transcriptional regulator [Mycobacterium sp. WUMAC-067]
MPKLWRETIESHRRDVRDTVLSTAAALVVEHGVRSVTMSQIAETAGIGRATLYKYFPDVDAILRSWHRCQIDSHLHRLRDISESAGSAYQRLTAALTAYAHIQQHSGRHDAELVRLVHADEHVDAARCELRDVVARLIADSAAAGQVRTDVDAAELATFCMHALTAAGDLRGDEAVARLVSVTMDALRIHP